MYTTVNGTKTEELLKKLARVWHPDNLKFVKSEQRLRDQHRKGFAEQALPPATGVRGEGALMKKKVAQAL